MEKRIKSIYIVTIIAILAFLAMQGYWLYERYEYALSDYERGLADRIVRCVDYYNEIRSKSSDQRSDSIKKQDDSRITLPTFSLSQQYGDTVKTTRTARIYTYRASAYELLGIKPGTPLTNEMKNKAVELAQQRLKEPDDSVVYDASGAKDESEAWAAAMNVLTERKYPFTVDGMDSVMSRADIKAQVSLVKADSMVWRTKVAYHGNAFRPRLTVTIPYSQMEGQVATITSTVNPFDVLPGMWQTMLITLLVSVLLIVCLMYQFSTILKFSRLDRLRNSFVTTMIHELKRPLSTLKMCISGMDNGRMMDDPEVKREILSETRNALDNLSAYFSKLRDITFNNVEQIPLNIQAVDLHDLFDEVTATVAVPPDKSVKVRNDIDKDVQVSADRSHLHSILTNLVENAIKYSGPSVMVCATAATDNDSVQIHVSDNGNGIAAGDLKHIFKRFYRGNASAGDQPGMGLGLAYVRLLVDAHGGDISVKSREGEGTCFTISLPQ